MLLQHTKENEEGDKLNKRYNPEYKMTDSYQKGNWLVDKLKKYQLLITINNNYYYWLTTHPYSECHHEFIKINAISTSIFVKIVIQTLHLLHKLQSNIIKIGVSDFER